MIITVVIIVALLFLGYLLLSARELKEPTERWAATLALLTTIGVLLYILLGHSDKIIVLDAKMRGESPLDTGREPQWGETLRIVNEETAREVQEGIRLMNEAMDAKYQKRISELNEQSEVTRRNIERMMRGY